MPLSRADTEAALAKKGFVREDTHHRYYYLVVDGQKTGIYRYVSTGTKYRELGDDLVSSMAKQLHLSRKQFLKLVECKLDGPGYNAVLRALGLLPGQP